MKTINNPIIAEGFGLMTGQPSKVEIKPSLTKGIKFYSKGSEIPVIANYKSVVSTDNCTVIANQSSQARLIEHFMAACAISGINSLEVFTDFPEMPIFDGSAKKWIELFNEAGLNHSEVSEITFDKPLYLQDGNAVISLIPADSFKVSYMINFDHSELKNRWMEFNLNSDKTEIIEARTFGYLKDLEKFQQMGLALGVNIENTIGLTEDGYTTELRSEYEPLKHKVLDIIGDLFLSGYNPLGFKCHILAQNAGHKSHVMFSKLIAECLGEE
ncbi:MAG: UDP-3-O-acyl-N-acetylglucosamine deacetylase [bacterium]